MHRARRALLVRMSRYMSFRRLSSSALAVLLSTLVVATAQAGPPSGFQDSVVISGLDGPATLVFAPDGRLFIGEKASGKVKVWKNGALLGTPFLDVNTVLPP